MPKRPLPADHKPLAGLPVRMITVGDSAEQIAVHVAGRLGPDRIPVICVPGYNRNMADYADFVRLGGQLLGDNTPIVLVDPKGRGRAIDRPPAEA
jgi:pimeloyl-ACP methyl ester carboxylesterase